MVWRHQYTNSVKQSPSREVNSRFANQAIPPTPLFMEPEGLLPYSQESAICPCPEPNESMKWSVFCYIMPCSPVKGNRRFGGTYRLQLQGRRLSQGRNQYELGSLPLLPANGLFCLLPVSSWFLAWLIIRTRGWKWRFRPKRRKTRRYIPEGSYFHGHCCENLKSDKLMQSTPSHPVSLISILILPSHLDYVS
jgi:hypothetical protein